MFKRQYRLPAQARLSHSKTITSPYFTVKISQNNLPHNRYGFVAGKVIDKRSVARNRLKRQFRAGVEGLHKEFRVGYDVLFILRKSALSVDGGELHEQVKAVLAKQGLLGTV